MPNDRSGAAPFDALLRALTDSDIIVQADAARLLGELRQPAAVAPLVRYVTEDRHYSKVAGLHALAEIGDRTITPALRPLVEEPNCPDDWYWYARTSVQAAAAVALLTLGDESSLPFLLKLADAGDEVLLCWYAPSLLKMAASPAVERVRSRITSAAICSQPNSRRFTDPGFAVMTARTLGLLGDSLACEKLRDMMKHQSRYVRGQAAVSLLQASATPPHVQAVRELLLTDPTDFVRIKTTLALVTAKQGDASAIVKLARSAADAFDRAVAIESLGLTGELTHRNVVIEALSHADSYVKRCAIEALDRLSTPQSAADSSQAVRLLLDDSNALVRLQAAKYFATRPTQMEAGR